VQGQEIGHAQHVTTTSGPPVQHAVVENRNQSVRTPMGAEGDLPVAEDRFVQVIGLAPSVEITCLLQETIAAAVPLSLAMEEVADMEVDVAGIALETGAAVRVVMLSSPQEMLADVVRQNLRIPRMHSLPAANQNFVQVTGPALVAIVMCLEGIRHVDAALPDLLNKNKITASCVSYVLVALLVCK